jgi:hypothetical protein
MATAPQVWLGLMASGLIAGTKNPAHRKVRGVKLSKRPVCCHYC